MSTFTFMVCPHDTVKEPDRWYRLEQQLIQQLGLEMQFELSLDFQDFHANLGKADIVYANPGDTLKLMQQQFVPLVRPQDKYDEAVFVASTELSAPTLESLSGAEIATVKSQIPTRIALHMLHERGIVPGALHDKDSWLSVISEVWNRAADYGIVYKDTYDNLSDQGKGMVQAIAESQERKAFHSIAIGPKLHDKQQEITAMLLAMDTDEKGKEVLAELSIAKWLPVTPEELAGMQQVMEMEV